MPDQVRHDEMPVRYPATGRGRKAPPMIDNFALALSHGLMLLAAWRLVTRKDLDDSSAPVPARAPTKGQSRFKRANPGA